MPLARFQSQLGSPVIDEASGVIKGVRIATLGAVSGSREGEGRGLLMDSEAIACLMKLAQDNGNRLPAFFTHAWFSDEKSDGLDHDAGVWNDFALDHQGNLTATFTAFDTKHKAGIFSRAKADPDGIAISPLFDYAPRNGSKTLCTPTRFLSSDFVKRGAINKALFTETQPKNRMITEDDKKEFRALLHEILAEPETKTALLKLAPEPKAATVDAKVIEDAVKASLDTHKVALLVEAKLAGESGATQFIGTGKFIKQSDSDASANEVEAAIAGYITSGAKNRGVAILRLANDKPALYNSAVAAGKL